MQCDYCVNFFECSQTTIQVIRNYFVEKIHGLQQISITGREKLRQFSELFSDYCDFCCGEYENEHLESTTNDIPSSSSSSSNGRLRISQQRKDTNTDIEITEEINQNIQSAKNVSKCEQIEHIPYKEYNNIE